MNRLNFMNLTDTIAAISSAAGPAARMIVRASGPLVRQIHQQLTGTDEFVAKASRRRLNFAGLSFPAWVYLFVSPRSYTGQDVLELHVPGNPLLARMLLEELFQLGARHAEPGEFTARAFFNGRIGLTEAEGVAAAIAAHSQREHAAARQLMAGELVRRLQPALDMLTETLALVEADIDFSDQDITLITAQQMHGRIDSIDAMLQSLLANSAHFERLTHEPRIVLVGRPNAGKSTLLNALAGQQRAVVSAQAGTTRDVIWAQVRLLRGTVRLIDAAGLDVLPPRNDLERQMQERSNRAVQEADVVVYIRDCTDQRQPIQLPRRPDLKVATKIDLGQTALADELAVSAIAGTNLQVLRERLDELAFGQDRGGAVLALNARHVLAIRQAQQALRRARQSSGAEIIALELRESLDALGSVLGQVTPDDVLSRIFATFCIGK